MHLKALLCLLTLLCGQVISAQQPKRSPYEPDKLFIRFNPMAATDLFDGNLSAGIEYRFGERWAVTMDAAWVLYSLYFENIKRTNGFIIRPSVRRYFGRANNTYFEAQLHYKDVIYTVKDWIDRDVTSGVGAYEEFTRFRYRKQAAGLHILFGRKIPLSRNKRFWMEFYGGVGLHYKTQGVYHEPNSAYSDANMGPILEFSRDGSSSVVPAMPAGIRFLWKIK